MSAFSEILELHDYSLSIINRLVTPEVLEGHPGLSTGFLRFMNVAREPLSSGDSSFAADSLEIIGFSTSQDTGPNDDLSKLLLFLEVKLFIDSSPYVRYCDLDRYPNGYMADGHHAVLMGQEVPPTLLHFHDSQIVHDNFGLLTPYRRDGIVEVLNTEQASSIKQALGKLTQQNIDFERSI